MMKNTYMKTLFAAAFGLIVLNGCGGGGSTGSVSNTAANTAAAENTVNKTSTVTTVKVPQCQDAMDYANDTQKIDVTDKNINSEGGDAEIRIWLAPDGSKSACVITGNATVL
jgi:uncharacterized lipoprotein YajG